MKIRKVLILIIILIIGSLTAESFINKKNKTTIVNYEGDNLKISIDGISATTLPTTGTYFLTDYYCGHNTVVKWDNINHKLEITNNGKKGGVACYLTFKSKMNVNELPIGTYIKYQGVGGKVGTTNVSCKINGSASNSTETAETEAPNSCLGQNAREDLEQSGNSYGYCHDPIKKYYTTGWRIAYILNNKAMLISAGSPECINRTSSNSNDTYIKTANSRALKYCNTNYVDGNCSCTDSNNDGLCDAPSTDAWAINDTDFYYITKAISKYGKRLTNGSSSLGDNGGTLNSLFCNGEYNFKECGYNNDLIDNGGHYWFASKSDSSANGVKWDSFFRFVSASDETLAFGSRFIISLSSSTYVTSGNGTISDPYVIGN